MLTASELDAQLRDASASFSRGELVQAETLCRSVLANQPNNVVALNLLGLVRAQGGDRQGAEELLRRSVDIDPADARHRLDLATFLRRDGRLEEAERVYRRVLQLAPSNRAARHGLVLTLDQLGRAREAEIHCHTLLEGDRASPEGWALLGFVLGSQDRLAEAESAYRQALSLAPASPAVQRRLGTLLARQERVEEALVTLDRARALGASGFELEFTRGRVLTQLGRLEEAERAFAAATEARPRNAEAQLDLARVRQALGEADFTRSLAAVVREAPQDVRLQEVLTGLLLRAERGDVAEQLLREQLRVAGGPVPYLRFMLSQVLREAQRLPEAETEALEAAAALPEESPVLENLVSILLSRGRADEALAFIRPQRARAPLAQGWIAYEATAARLLGQPAYRELYDYQRFVRVYDLRPPPPFSTMTQLNAALEQALTRRQRPHLQPLRASLRNGQQTIRNLVTDPEPALRALMRAFEEPLRAYLAALGSASDHPFSARNTGAAQLKSAWSSRLDRGGFHVNHVHEQSWISSAYYVHLPEEANDEALKSGWLKLGEPRYPTPDAGVGCYVQPRPGQLVLFPSYMWHGTTPIRGAQPRISLSFDALPAERG